MLFIHEEKVEVKYNYIDKRTEMKTEKRIKNFYKSGKVNCLERKCRTQNPGKKVKQDMYTWSAYKMKSKKKKNLRSDRNCFIKELL